MMENTMEMDEATYITETGKPGRGIYFYTDCCHNQMFHIGNDPMIYHGCLCPKCYNLHNKRTVLYLRGTEEANRVLHKRVENEEEVFNKYLNM